MPKKFGRKTQPPRVFHYRSDNEQIAALQDQNERQKASLDRILKKFRKIQSVVHADKSPIAVTILKILEDDESTEAWCFVHATYDSCVTAPETPV